MKNHKLYKIWNQVPVTYYQSGVRINIFQRIWHGRKISVALNLIRNLKFKNCLDVGCASGYMLSQIQKFFPDVRYFGVDIFDKAINYAKKQYPTINFQVATADILPFDGESFDLVLCYETIEHVEDPISVLKEIRRVLKRSGTLILAMDSGNWLFRLVWFIWENTKGSAWKGAHLHPFKDSELERLVVKSGFKIKKRIFSHLGMEVAFVLTK